MNLNKELKLAIYESSLDKCDKEDLLNIVESTNDEDVLRDVMDMLTESYKDKTSKDKLTMEDIGEIKEDLASYRGDLKEIKSLIKNKKYTMANIKIKHAKDRLKRIEKILKEIPTDTDDKIKTSIISGLKTAAIYLGAVTMLDIGSNKFDNGDFITNAKVGAILGGVSSIGNMSSNWKKRLEGEVHRQYKLLEKLSGSMKK